MTLRPGHAALVAALLAGAVAAPAIRGGFVEDDHWVVEQRPLLQHPPSLAAVLRAPYWPAGFGNALWRPAVLASYALDYRFSTRPAWFHAVNVVWAMLATGLLALAAARLGDPALGVATGVLFAVHPVHVEAVANVVGRAELMAAAGVGLALCAALSLATGAGRRALVGVVGGAALAIASKENAAALPAAIPLVVTGRALIRGESWRPALRRALVPAAWSAAPVALYFVLRSLVVSGGVFSVGGVAPGLGGLGPAGRAWGMLPVSLEWWRLLFAPVRLSADYSPAEVVVATGLTWGHALAAGVGIGLAALAWRLWSRTRAPALGLAWVVLTVAPVANVLVPTELLAAERTLYLPSWGAMLALAGLGAAWPVSTRAKVVILAGLVFAGAWRSVTRIPVWRDEAHFSAALMRDAPRSYRSLWLAARAAFDANQWGTGEQRLREAIAAAPQIPGPKEDLARIYGSVGLWQPAVRLLEESIAVDSTRPRPWTQLPDALLRAGDTAAAARVARAAMQRFPADSEVQASAAAVLAAITRR